MSLITVAPLTADRWPDLADLFTTSEVMRGCWCMWPRTRRDLFEFGDVNQDRLKSLVDEGTVPGLVAYVDGTPAGWCSVGPRPEYRRFFDEQAERDVWLIACFFVAASHRGQQVGTTLLNAAACYAAGRGARRIEGLPHGWRPDDDRLTMDAVMRMFERAGFTMSESAGAVARAWRDVRPPDSSPRTTHPRPLFGKPRPFGSQ